MKQKIQATILDLLRLDHRESAAAARLSDAEWKSALYYCDRHQLTLPLAGRRLDGAPEWVVARLQGNVAANRLRQAKLFELYGDLNHFDHVVLKGFAQWPYLCPDPELRTQYDLDLYCLPETLTCGVEAAKALGYEPAAVSDRFPVDHLPPMVRKTGWQWRGDFFDPDIPVAVELHFRFWDRETERFGPANLDEFWQRRETRTWKTVTFQALNEMDSLGYACLHALRHLLRGDPRVGQFYEIAWFLERQKDPVFWATWRQSHHQELRSIEAVCFRFAQAWFGCRLAPTAQAEVEDLDEAIQQWFKRWSHSPLEAPFHVNKDELWLHLSLLETSRDKALVLRRRLLPLVAPGPVDGLHIPDDLMTAALRRRRAWRYAVYVSGRVLHHLQALAPVAVTGTRWWLIQSGLTPDYWRFYAAAAIFNLALMIFYLLYNLHLVSLGFDEGFVGQVTFAMHMGSLLGSLAAGVAATRIGLRPSLFFCFVATGLTLCLRTQATGRFELLAFAAAAGIVQSVWAVCLAPAVTALTTERSRSAAFSLTFGTGIALGMFSGVVGGRLPAWLHSTRNALLLAAAVAPLAVLPLLRWKLPAAPPAAEKRVYAMSPFLVRFLGMLAIWGAATGAFNPFFSLLFSRGLGFGVAQIGGIFSLAQGAQVLAMLISPLVLKRFGIAPAIALMQCATGIALAGLGVAPPVLAGWMYGLYMAFQYMSEPGMYTLLMSNVPPEQRAGASALNFVTLFGSQAIAAWIAGEAIARYGYTPVLLVAAALTLLAAQAMTLVTRSR